MCVCVREREETEKINVYLVATILVVGSALKRMHYQSILLGVFKLWPRVTVYGFTFLVIELVKG